MINTPQGSLPMMALDNNNTKTRLTEFIATKQASFFHNLKQSQFTGKVCFKTETEKQWVFSMYLGRIVYATGGLHPVRRYKRNLSVYMPEMIAELAILERDCQAQQGIKASLCWEYDLLSLWVEEKKITPKQLSDMVFAQVAEILFDLTQAKELSVEYISDKFIQNPLSVIDSEQAVVEAWKLWQSWQRAQIADRSPDMAPVIAQPEQLYARTSLKTYQGMSKLMDGKKSLRDLAVLLKQDLVHFTSLLKPYIQLGLIELNEIGDLPIPINTSITSKLLIACIDDSPLVCKTMETIVTSNGYDFLAITEDLRAIATLLNHKPDIIFVDLIMPHLNGYEICSKLRKVEVFSQIPIIILSAHTNLFDRLRGKISGCSKFLSKPINPTEVLSVIEKHKAAKVSEQD